MSSLYRPDLSIESANTPTSYNVQRTVDTTTYRCMVLDVTYVDDANNITKNGDNPQVLYKVVILGGFKEGQTISNVRAGSLLGGNYNFHEQVYRKSSKILNKDPLNTHDGDIVFVQFIQGDPKAPIILGCGTNALDKDNTGATKLLGPQNVIQYNGVHQLINKTGEFQITRKGGIFDEKKGYFIPVDSTTEKSDSKETFQAKFHLLDNKMLWSDPKSSILFEKDTQKYTLSVGKSGEGDDALPMYTKVIDGVIEKSITTYKSGLIIEEDGAGDKIITTFKSGLKIEEDGTGDKVKITTAGGAVIKVEGGKVAIGSSSAELLQQISDTLDKIKTWAETVGSVHTHLGNLGYTTAPPDQSGDYTALGGDLGTIKGLIDGIKGTI